MLRSGVAHKSPEGSHLLLGGQMWSFPKVSLLKQTFHWSGFDPSSSQPDKQHSTFISF